MGDRRDDLILVRVDGERDWLLRRHLLGVIVAVAARLPLRPTLRTVRRFARHTLAPRVPRTPRARAHVDESPSRRLARWASEVGAVARGAVARGVRWAAQVGAVARSAVRRAAEAGATARCTRRAAEIGAVARCVRPAWRLNYGPRVSEEMVAYGVVRRPIKKLVRRGRWEEVAREQQLAQRLYESGGAAGREQASPRVLGLVRGVRTWYSRATVKSSHPMCAGSSPPACGNRSPAPTLASASTCLASLSTWHSCTRRPSSVLACAPGELSSRSAMAPTSAGAPRSTI